MTNDLLIFVGVFLEPARGTFGLQLGECEPETTERESRLSEKD